MQIHRAVEYNEMMTKRKGLFQKCFTFPLDFASILVMLAQHNTVTFYFNYMYSVC